MFRSIRNNLLGATKKNTCRKIVRRSRQLRIEGLEIRQMMTAALASAATSIPVATPAATQPWTASAIAVGQDAMGGMELFSLCPVDQQVYISHFDAIGGGCAVVGNASAAQNMTVTAMAVGREASGGMELFGINGGDHQVYVHHFDAGGNPVGWYSLVPSGPASAIAIGNDEMGSMELFALCPVDQQVYVHDFDGGNPIGGYNLPRKLKLLQNRPATTATYTPVSGSLFGPNGPSYQDVKQGGLGDCWLLASLAEVAARDPADIRNMFTADGITVENGSVVSVYTVRFFDSAGAAAYVTVDTELPTSSGSTIYDQPVNGVLWVALAEKAYAEANGARIVTTSCMGSDSYASLEGRLPTQSSAQAQGGLACWALQAITGKEAIGFNSNNFTTNYTPTKNNKYFKTEILSNSYKTN